MAALATYLVSEAADPVNGCIFEVFHGHVGLYVEPPAVEKIIEKDGRWTPEELAVSIPEILTPGRFRQIFPETLTEMFRAESK